MAKTCNLHKSKHGPNCTLTKGGDKNPTIGAIRQKGTFNQSGVHMPPLSEGAGGTSVMGLHVRENAPPSSRSSGSKEMARRHAKANLQNLRNMPKPKLDKAEHSPSCKKSLAKSEEGSHDPQTTEGTHDPCPYCADSEDNRTDDCAYCQDLDAEENADGTAGMHECPACQEYDAANQETGAIDDCPYCSEVPLEVGGSAGVDPCPYCENETIGEAEAGTPAEQGAEDHHQCNCPNCPKNDQTGLAVEDMGAERPDDCPECQKMYADAVENQPDQTGQGDPNLQGHETAEEVLDLLDQEPGASPTPAQEAQKIDNTELPQGDAMKDGTSVTEDFGDKQKGDISDAEATLGNSTGQGQDPGPDQPDMTGVLQSGLDDHANEQKKQQVLDMVGQTLAGFKANKASLEATKEQNQALYNSCIQMLKSMIALCDLLGLKPQAAPAPQPEPSSGPPDSPMPPQGGAPAEEPADPKAVA